MLKLGVIGTGWISSSFVEAAHLTKKYQIEAVYSRQLANAVSFTEDWDDISLYEEIDEFFAHDMDVIYIASPNSLHFEQARAALESGKNVIVEKPAFSNPDELKAIMELAYEKKLFFFEAARNIHEKAFTTVNDFLADKTIVGADFTYSKYSSRMPAYLRGELPNKFNAEFSGGLLADLGVYLLYAAIYWFGKPKQARYSAVLLPTGVDVSGVGYLDYSDFKVAIKCAGNFTSYLPCEIYTNEGTLILNSVNDIKTAKFVRFDGAEELIKIAPAKQNLLFDEALHFAEIMENPTSVENRLFYQALHSFSRDVAATSFLMRQDAGIVFPADKKS